jgi:hypothetical protein
LRIGCCGPKRNEATRDWRRLHNEKLYALYASQNIRVIKSRRMRWVGHVERRGTEEVLTGFWWGYLRERDYSEDLGLDGWIILNCYFSELGWHVLD